jgi:hypothetical protein
MTHDGTDWFRRVAIARKNRGEMMELAARVSR